MRGNDRFSARYFRRALPLCSADTVGFRMFRLGTALDMALLVCLLAVGCGRNLVSDCAPIDEAAKLLTQSGKNPRDYQPFEEGVSQE
jgi:hypothetical protein